MRSLRFLCVVLIVLSTIIIAAAQIVVAQDEEPATINLPITQDVTYIIQQGDTLDGIAATFDVSLDCLRETNDLSPSIDEATIFPNQELLISVECPFYFGLTEVLIPRPDAPGRVNAAGEYLVKPGDVLDLIAQELDINVEVLKQANEITSASDLMPGMVLTVPEGAPAYNEVLPLDDTAGAGGGAEGELYIVQPRDTLDTIAQELNISIVSLKLVNELEDGAILQIGQVLVIPEDAPPYGAFPATDAASAEGGGAGGGVEGDLYIMQPRDTIDQIAADYNVSSTCIIEANEISNVRLLRPGQTIVIPTGCPVYSGFGVPRTTTTTETQTETEAESEEGD